MRVLVVDDSRVIRQLAQMALAGGAGWEVQTVESGEAALDVASARPPEAILLDSMMPGMDGSATLSSLQADPRTRDVPVIMVTADEEPGSQAAFERLGAVGVIHKPFALDRLADQVSALIAST